MSILVKHNIHLDKYSGKKDEVDTSGPVECFYLDADRDERLGYALSKYNLNYIFDKKDERDFKFKSILLKDIDPEYLPSSVDLRSVWGDIHDQGDIGSCVSQSVAYQLRHLLRKTIGKSINMSRLFIYYNGRVLSGFPVHEDTGLTMRNGFRSVTSYGAPEEDVWPYITYHYAKKPSDVAYNQASHNKKLAYYSVSQNLPEMKKCLKDGYAISFGITLFDSFMSTAVAKTGIVPMPNEAKEQRIGGHAMTIVGYDDSKKAFIVVNSWGRAWGDEGYCYMPYALILNRTLAGDFWTPREFSISSPPSDTTPSPTPAPGPIPAPPPSTQRQWAPNTQYKSKDFVSYLGHLYRCNISHKSISIWTPVAVPALWRRV